MSKANDPLQPLIDHLHSNGRLRVWSLVVTVLGDVITPRGGDVLMSDLLAILAHLRVPEGAVRTALSRLSKGGWVQSRRQGRISRYSFGPKGIAQFEPAEARIYAAPECDIGPDWAVLMPRTGAASYVTELSQISATAARAKQNLVLGPEISVFPNWIKSAVATPEALDAFKRFTQKYARLATPPTAMPPIDALCARILLIHDWRRLALRTPPLPQVLHPLGWARPEAHVLAAQAYHALLAQSERYWPDEAGDDGAQMLAQRFRPKP